MKQKLILGMIMLSSAGCAGLTHKQDMAATHSIKRAALVGFAVLEPIPAFNMTGTMQQKDLHVETMFQDLSSTIQKNLGWTMVDGSAMKADPAYTSDFHQYMDGFQNKMPPGKGQKAFIAEGIMDDQCTRIMGQSGRDALMKALNVDAIFVARVDMMIHGTTVMGIGSRHPQARLSFQVYRLGVENPVWFEGAIDGDEQPSVGSTGMSIDEGLFKQYSIQSARVAYNKITPDLQ